MAGERHAPRSGQMSAWIMKKKSGASMVRVRQYNKRYFTIDFDARVFFYAHSATTKKVNAVVPFADIADVSRPEANVDPQESARLSETSSQTSRTSRVSLIRRLSSSKLLLGKGDEEKENKGQQSLTVSLRSSRSMELTFASAAEAVEWFEALTAAKSAGGGDVAAAQLQGLQSAEERRGSGDKGDDTGGGDGHAVGAAPPASGGYPAGAEAAPGARRPPPLPPRAPAAAPGGAVATPAAPRAPAAAEPAAAAPQEEEAADAAEAAPPKPPVHGTLWDLGTEAESDAGALGAEAADVRPPGEEAEVVEAVGEAVGAMSLQATDFGFDGMEASDSDSEPDDVPGSARATAPRGADAAGGAPASAGAGAGPDECEGGEAADGTQGQTRAGSYADRSQGLTLQQRLANMEFSDDEDDDDDDPLGIKAKE